MLIVASETRCIKGKMSHLSPQHPAFPVLPWSQGYLSCRLMKKDPSNPSPLDINKDLVSNVHQDKKAVLTPVRNEPCFRMPLGNTVQSSGKTFRQTQLLWFAIMGAWTALLPGGCVVPANLPGYYITNTPSSLTVDIGKASVVKSRSLKAVTNLRSLSPLILFSTSSTQATP